MGQAPPELLRPLLDVLGRFTAEPSDCVHVLWEGWGWLGEGSWAVLTSSDGTGPPERMPDARPGLPDDVLRLPRLQLPNRAYLLFAGPLEAARRGLIEPVLVGPQAKIRAVAEAHGLDLGSHRILDTEHSHEAATKAVAMARAGEVDSPSSKVQSKVCGWSERRGANSTNGGAAPRTAEK